jgi:hypothetical protein
VLRRMFRPKRDEATGGWRKLHNEDLHNMYCSPNIIKMIKPREMKLAVHVARIGRRGMRGRILLGKPEGKRPLGRHRFVW